MSYRTHSTRRLTSRQLRERSQARHGLALCIIAALGFAMLIGGAAYADACHADGSCFTQSVGS